MAQNEKEENDRAYSESQQYQQQQVQHEQQQKLKDQKKQDNLEHLEIEDDEFLKLVQQPEHPRSFSEIVNSVKGSYNFSQKSELTKGYNSVR